jgi:hypothetical protein
VERATGNRLSGNRHLYLMHACTHERTHTSMHARMNA